MPGKRGADDDDYVPPSGAARGAKKHPVSEAVLRFATEKKGAKADLILIVSQSAMHSNTSMCNAFHDSW